MRPLTNNDKQIQALKRELVMVSFLGVPGPIMAVTAGMSLFGGEDYLLHPVLANPALTGPMLVFGIVLMFWEVCRVLPLQAKLRSLQSRIITPSSNHIR